MVALAHMVALMTPEQSQTLSVCIDGVWREMTPADVLVFDFTTRTVRVESRSQ